MPFTSTDLATIDDHIALGVRRVTFADGRTTEYNSGEEMRAARALIVAEISKATAAAAGRPARRMRFARYSTGL
jgi:hypothetical protein